MFKLITDDNNKELLTKKLRLYEFKDYKYVVTTNKKYIEDDKINIIFSKHQCDEVNTLLDLIVYKQPKHINCTDYRGTKRVKARDIDYVYFDDNSTIAVIRNKQYTVKETLTELEDYLFDKDFVRINKYTLVNILKIDYIQPALNSRVDLLMNNSDVITVNRTYLKRFRKKIKE